MRAPLKQLATMMMATSAVSLLCLNGCEKLESQADQADRQVAQKVEESQQARLKGDAGREAAQQALDAAAAITQASAATRANALTLQAQTELASANAILRHVDGQEIAAARLVWGLNQLGARVQSGNDLIASYGKFDPKSTLDALAQKTAEVQGGANQEQWNDQKIPTLSAIKQEVSRLQGEIARKQDLIKGLTESRSKVIDEAEKAGQASLGETGEKSVQLYKQGSDLRKQAADLAQQIDQANGELAPLEKDLAVATAQQTVLGEVLKQYKDQESHLKTQWEQVQKQVEAQQATSKAILEGTAPAAAADEASKPGGSIAQKAVELARLVQQLETARAEAIACLQNAQTHFGQAVDQANAVVRDMGTKMNDPALAKVPQADGCWRQLKSVYNPASFMINQGIAAQTLAGVYANQAQSLSLRLQLSKSLNTILTAAQLTLPTELQEGDLAAELKTARDKAEHSYTDAAKLFNDAAEVTGSAPEQKQAAWVAQAMALYGESEIKRAAGDTKDADDLLTQARDARNKAMEDARNRAMEQNAVLPTMPADLAVPPKIAAAPAGAPDATKPEAAPTSAPAPQ